MTSYLLDTDVLSELMAAPTRKRRRKIEAWLRSVGNEAVFLSSVSIAEINRGIALLKNPPACLAIRKALDQILLVYGDAVITPTHTEWQRFAQLSAVPELRTLCHGKNRNNQPRTGADLFLAIQAVTAGCAIASLNTKDFILIERHLPLTGGIIDPVAGDWGRR